MSVTVTWRDGTTPAEFTIPVDKVWSLKDLLKHLQTTCSREFGTLVSYTIIDPPVHATRSIPTGDTLLRNLNKLNNLFVELRSGDNRICTMEFENCP